jgi:hypothetical protein
MARKRAIKKSRMKPPAIPKPLTRDPTLDEIRGVGGLAEQERMKRPQERWPEFPLPEREEVRE